MHGRDRRRMKGEGEREKQTGHRSDREGMKGGGRGRNSQATGGTDATDRTWSLSLGMQATQWPTDCVAVSQSCTGPVCTTR